MRGMEDEPGRMEQGGSRRGEIVIESARGRRDGLQVEEEEQMQQEEADAQEHPSAIATTIATAPLRHQENRMGRPRRPRKEERKQM